MSHSIAKVAFALILMLCPKAIGQSYFGGSSNKDDCPILPAPVASYDMATAPPMLDGVGSAHGICTTDPTCPDQFATAGTNNNGPYYLFHASSGELITIPGTSVALHSNNALTVMYDFSGSLTLIEDLLNRADQINIGGSLGLESLLTVVGGFAVGTNGEEVNSGWHNLAFVFDGAADTITSYVDGVFSRQVNNATEDLTLNTFDITLSHSNTLFSLGGVITNLQFFDVALSSCEVRALEGVAL